MGRTVDRPSLSFLQHWLEALLVAIVVVIVACVLVQLALPAVTTFVAQHLLLLITLGVIALLGGAAPWIWKACKAIDLYRQERKDRKAYRELLVSAKERLDQGFNLKYSNSRTGDQLEVSNPFVRGRGAAATTVEEVEEKQMELAAPALPTHVRYEDVRNQIPAHHILIGVGRSGLETREAAVGACTWVVGNSGSGKTSTTTLRVEERYAAGHKFLGCDPHFFKPDSLTNSLKAYAHAFLQPMARTSEQMKVVLVAFLEEFRGRKSGQIAQPWQPITLLVDEVNALMDPADEIEEEIAKMLKSIARICGQEARDFRMGGIFISQQATGLAWLRKVSLMVIVHQLLMESEKRLALNGDKEAIEDMKSWPVGRTYVYGVGFQDGPRTVQQPYFTHTVDALTLPSTPFPERSEGASSNQTVYASDVTQEQAQEVDGMGNEPQKDVVGFELKKLLGEIGKMKTEGKSNAEILKHYELHPAGRNNTNLGTLVEIIEEARRA